jgi:hypothetical protein
MRLESIEVAVAVKKLLLCFQTERRYKAVNCFADRDASASQESVVLGRSQCQVCPAGLKNRQPCQIALDLQKNRIAADALQDFAIDEVSQPQRLLAQLPIEPGRMLVLGARQIVNPNSGIYQHHREPLLWNPALPGFSEVSFPFHFATPAPHRGLSVGLDQQTESHFHGRLFGAYPAAAHGLPH